MPCHTTSPRNRKGLCPPIGYVCLPLPDYMREKLMGKIAPRYPLIKADHITLHYGVTENSRETTNWIQKFPSADVQIYGVADDRLGIQCLLAKVNSACEGEQGRIYHITWSRAPDIQAPAHYNADGRISNLEASHANFVARQREFITLWKENDNIIFQTSACFKARTSLISPLTGHARPA